MASPSEAWRIRAFDEIFDAVVVVDDERRYVDANPAAYALLGLKRGELVGRRIDDVAPVLASFGTPETWPAFLERGHDAGVFPLVRADGTRAMIEYRARAHVAPGAHVSVLRDATGLGEIFDLTAGRELRRAPAGAEQAQRLLADAGVPLAESLDERETAQAVAALTIGSFADGCFIDLRDSDTGELKRAAYAPAGQGEAPPSERARPVRLGSDWPGTRAQREGEPVLARGAGAGWPSLVSVPLRARGETFGAMTLARGAGSLPFTERDLSFAFEVGRRVSVAIDNAKLYASAMRARAAAEEANRAKDQFLAVLGHELRNPLAPITTALRLMALGDGNVFVVERAIIERQVQHMTRLVDDLLDVSRIVRGKVELRRRSVEIADVVAKAVEIASPALEERKHRLEVAVPGHGLTVYGDAARLAQVFANLLTNAAKYTAPGGQVTVRASREDDTVHVCVSDTGVGIAPEVLPHIFEVFVQGSRRDTVRAGLGLGLAIVRSLTELHGGRVRATSRGVDAGSEFVVELPFLETATYRSLRPTPREHPAVTGRPKRILVVDDNADAAEMLAEWLGTIGHGVRVAGDGPTALEVAADFLPDVALLDIGLPVMDGYEVARRLRDLPGCSQTRLIALTGYGQESDYDRSRRAGFEEHLVKPVDLDAIQRVVSLM